MAFMALFGWIFIPIILLYFIFQAVAAPLLWAIEHPAAVNTVAAGLLALNLLLFLLLLLVRRRRKRAGKPKGIITLLAALWEAWVVFLCALFLIIQPLRLLPPGFGELFSLENNCYGVWTVVSCQGTSPGCTQTQEEIDAFLGRQIAYSEDRFVSTDWAYSLEGYEAYQDKVVWQEGFPPLYSLSLEDLGIEKKNLRYVEITLPKGTEDDQPLGRELYVLDKNTLLLYRKGVFFRAERTDLPVPERLDRPIPPKIRDLSAPAYFGTWKVAAFLGASPEEPMEEELIEKTLGAELEYQAEHVLFQRTDYGGGAMGPEYEETKMTAEAFQEAYGVSLEDLGVEPGTYLHVAMSVWESEPFFNDLGGRFLLLDGETMLLCSKGAFFRAELVPDSWPMIPDPNFELPVPNS